MEKTDIKKRLLKEAKKCLITDDVPVSAIIVENGKIISIGHNTREKDKRITGHAEINAVEKACKLKNTWHLTECELYVSLEPCKMCIEIIKQARIKKVYYYAKQAKTTNNPNIKIEKLKEDNEFIELLKNFFKNKRK